METTEEKKYCETKKCCCPCHMMCGVFIILIGVVILLRALDVLSPKVEWISIAVLVMLFGLKKMFAGKCKCCDKS
ncbi:MAG TPA: hypothetical protein VKJ65_12630 [Phycisphaerae bacterium]|nr:hypothetical protein [Phycisphaerae bacterium]